jgi:hypothetical protein
MSLTQRYVAHDHKRFCLLTFPEGLVPPLSITLDDPPAGSAVFWYDPGTIESTDTAFPEVRPAQSGTEHD